MARTSTPPIRDPQTGITTVRVHRMCNGCGFDLGDASAAEVEAAIAGAPLPDVRTECPDCGGPRHE